MAAADNPTGRPTIDVRKHAEQPVPKTPTDVSGMSAEEIGGLLYELEVHQEELKIQNEELRRLQLELESLHDRFADLYDFAPVGYVTVDANGLIINANLMTVTMLGWERAKIVGTRLALHCDEGSRIKLRDHLEKVLSSKMSQSCELKFTTSHGALLDVRLDSNVLVASGASDDRQFRVIMTDISRRKIAESKLRESEERYRRLVENTPFCIHEIELDGTLSAVNPAGLTMAGLSDESEIYGVEYLSEVSESDRPRIGKLLEQTRHGQTTYFELENSRGQVFESCFVPLTDGTGKVQRIMGIAQEISGRRRTEIALRESEHLFRTMFEQAAVGVARLETVSGVILQFNKRYCDILGLPEEYLVGRSWMDLTHPDDMAANLAGRERLLAGDVREFTMEKRILRTDGSCVWIHLTASPMWQPGEEPTTHIAIVKDITERKQAEESLRVSEERYRSLVTSSAATIWITNPDGGFSSAQPMWEAFTGQRWEEHQDYGWAHMLHPEDVEQMTSAWREAVQNAQPFFNQGRIFQAATGQYRYCEVHATPLLNPDGSVREWFGVTIDIHDRRLAESELAVRNQLLEAIRTIQSEFVAGEKPQTTFDKLLAVLLDITSGEYGFIGGILHDDAGAPFLKTYAITNIAWDDATRKFYDEQAPAGLEFRNLENLFGTVITSGRAVITNDAANDPRSGGLPPGHPSLNAFMGLPIYSQNEFIGMVGVANCPGGISKELVDLLEPFLATCGNLIKAFRNEHNRRETEDALRESRERFRQVAENINEVFWLHDLVANKVLYVSPRYEDTWGRSTEALYADSLEWANAIHPEDRERVEKSFLEQAEFDEWVEEYRIVRPDATERCIQDRAFPIRDESGAAIRLAGISKDITDRKNAELALRESEEKFRALTEKSPAIVLIARLDDILYCNSMLSEVSGYSHEELLRTPLRDIVHPDFRESIADRQLRRLRGEDVPPRYDGKIVTKSGEERWLDVSVQLIEFEGAPAALVTCVNVTARRLAEEALRQSEETLREVIASLEQRVVERTAELTDTNAELTAFAHTVSHDLRAPLRAMEGFATALSEDYGERLDEEGHEFIRHIVDSARRMDDLISDLLTYSRLGRETLSINPISLNSTANEALSHLRADLEACDAKVDVAEQMATVLGHRSTLIHIVTNLLSNAMKFVAPSVRPEVRLWTEPKGDGSIRLWIEDNGIGVNAAYQDRIFRVFERLHGIESYPGTGIGLAIVARACERLGGRCGFESQLGQGSRFWVELPEGDR